MTGFKNFILRGNLVELAVALIMALAFAAVVTATVDLSSWDRSARPAASRTSARCTPGGLLVGAWVTAVISFLIIAAVVYFLIVMPYTKAKERYFPSPEPGTPEDVKLLQEIRDLLAQQSGGTTATVTPPDP